MLILMNYMYENYYIIDQYTKVCECSTEVSPSVVFIWSWYDH